MSATMTRTRKRTTYLATEQLADKLHVSRLTIQIWVRKRWLPVPVRVGRRLLWVEEEIDQLLERSRVEGWKR
jgi:excisionase family DNA binding protein